MVLYLYLRSPLGIIFFQSLDKFGGAFEEPFLRLEDRSIVEALLNAVWLCVVNVDRNAVSITS